MSGAPRVVGIGVALARWTLVTALVLAGVFAGGVGAFVLLFPPFRWAELAVFLVGCGMCAAGRVLAQPTRPR